MRTFLKSSDQRGAAAVEFAIVLPLLVLLFAGIVEFSLILYNQQVITNASREAVRAAINPPKPPAPEMQMADIVDIANDYIENKLITFGGSNNLDSVVCKIDGVLSNDCTRAFADNNNVTIEVQYTYSFLMPQIIQLGTARVLHAETTMRMM